MYVYILRSFYNSRFLYGFLKAFGCYQQLLASLVILCSYLLDPSCPIILISLLITLVFCHDHLLKSLYAYFWVSGLLQVLNFKETYLKYLYQIPLFRDQGILQKWRQKECGRQGTEDVRRTKSSQTTEQSLYKITKSEVVITGPTEVCTTFFVYVFLGVVLS